MSTTNVVQQMVKPPVQVFGIEGRYATALYSAASKQKQLDIVEKELVNFQGSMKTDVKLREFIENPTIKRNLKSEGLKAVCSKISLSPQSTNLLQLLAENGRLKRINQVINAFKVIMAAHRGEVILLNNYLYFYILLYYITKIIFTNNCHSYAENLKNFII